MTKRLGHGAGPTRGDRAFDPVLDQEQAFAEHNDRLPVRLHLVWESQQDVAGPRSLVDRLTTREQ